MSFLQRSLRILGALVLGALLTETFLRAVLPVEIRFETWFTPGIEEWDPEFGAVYRPGWKGFMRHPDRVYRGVLLELDEHGFRPAARNPIPGDPRRVLLLGGRSAMMAYGLPEPESIAARMAARATIPMEVHAAARAGGNLHRSWHLYRKHLAGQDWDLVVISHVNPYLPAFADSEAIRHLPPPAPEAWVFRYMDGILLWRSGLIADIGRPAFRSYLGYGLLRLADAGLRIIRGTGRPSGAEHQAAMAREARPPAPDALENYQRFLTEVRDHFAGRGVPTLLHFIPRPLASVGHHRAYREPLEETFEVIDLHDRLFHLNEPSAFIANGHYGTRIADAIGRELALEAESVLRQEAGQSESRP
jgi:hypothetical protein